jgi:hypothetical protein
MADEQRGTRPEGEFGPLVAALRAAISASSGAAARPGQLRARIDEALGPDAPRFRREVHRLVAAAEDHLPANLTRFGPASPETLDRLAAELAHVRGWTIDAAQRTTALWAAALGVAPGLSWSDPPVQAPPREATPPAPVTAQTALPEPVVPPPAAVPPPVAAPSVAAPSWPATNARRVHLVQGLAPTETPPVCTAYAGVSLALVAAEAAVLIAAIWVLILFTSPGVAVAVAAGVVVLFVGLTIATLRRGLLIATPTGLRFVPLGPLPQRPRIEDIQDASWAEAQVNVGTVSIVSFRDLRLQLGPRNGGFARAAAAVADQHRFAQRWPA